ncbi:MAG: tellurite resistance/C4-dicarboxylate transporter family protein [candidate division NC10 bacterium]|nr:tellurite resistance/C4-dicarboxylate transporter family protein [candidate division NC10 bacterium]
MRWRAHLSDLAEQGVRDLHPSYFTLVMATGILSTASHLLGMPAVAWVLFQVTLGAYVILTLLTGVRLVRYFPRLLADLIDHARGPFFFAVVAATNVLGNQFLVVAGDAITAAALWVLGVFLWFTLTYTFFTAVTVIEEKPGLETGLNGGWLMAVVATQSVSVLGTLVSPHVGASPGGVLFFTLSMYLLGCMLYILMISLIIYRFMFFSLTPTTLTPPYWINTGAIAITTSAGALLIVSAPRWSFLQEILPFLKGFTLFFWVTGTWWIPLLLLLGAWRHFYMGFPFSYDPQYWSIVFPLGMYTTCTFQLAQATGLGLLSVIPQYFVYIALVAWLVTFFGLIRTLVRNLASPPMAKQPSEASKIPSDH